MSIIAYYNSQGNTKGKKEQHLPFILDITMAELWTVISPEHNDTAATCRKYDPTSLYCNLFNMKL